MKFLRLLVKIFIGIDMKKDSPELMKKDSPELISGFSLSDRMKLTGSVSYYVRDRKFRLREVCLPNEICFGGMLDRVKIRKLSASDATFYLIVDVGGRIIHGMTELYAARERGDKTIMVYFPDGSESDVKFKAS